MNCWRAFDFVRAATGSSTTFLFFELSFSFRLFLLEYFPGRVFFTFVRTLTASVVNARLSRSKSANGLLTASQRRFISSPRQGPDSSSSFVVDHTQWSSHFAGTFTSVFSSDGFVSESVVAGFSTATNGWFIASRAHRRSAGLRRNRRLTSSCDWEEKLATDLKRLQKAS